MVKSNEIWKDCEQSRWNYSLKSTIIIMIIIISSRKINLPAFLTFLASR
jgi:hypothetical protein